MAISIVCFAYTGKIAQLAVILGIQTTCTIGEIIFKIEDKLVNRILSITHNAVLIVYMAIMFMFLDKNPSDDDVQGQGVALFISVYIIIHAIVISVLGIITFITKLLNSGKEKAKEEANINSSMQSENDHHIPNSDKNAQTDPEKQDDSKAEDNKNKKNKSSRDAKSPKNKESNNPFKRESSSQ